MLLKTAPVSVLEVLSQPRAPVNKTWPSVGAREGEGGGGGLNGRGELSALRGTVCGCRRLGSSIIKPVILRSHRALLSDPFTFVLLLAIPIIPGSALEVGMPKDESIPVVHLPGILGRLSKTDLMTGRDLGDS